MHLINQGAPFLDISVVLIEQREVERTVSVERPWHVDHHTSGEVNSFGSHVLDVVEVSKNTCCIASKTKLVGHIVVLEDSSIGLIISWVAVYKAIQCQRIERKTPVGWRRKECMIVPFS